MINSSLKLLIMKNYCSCISCKKVYGIKGIITHYARSHGSDAEKAKYSSGYNGKYHILAERAVIRKENEKLIYNLNPRLCLHCNNIIPFEDDLNNKFCNHSCAASYSNKKRADDGWEMSEETKQQISDKNTGKTYTKLTHVICCKCNVSFNLECRPDRDLSKIRCDGCIRISRLRHRPARDITKLKDYRLACSFKFNLKDYPTEFDFTLIESFGWYKAANHGNNLYGVSRDHMVSVRYGFDNNIDPTLIAHPANCKLMQHSLNVKKYTDNSITYKELLIKIKGWDLKYPTKVMGNR